MFLMGVENKGFIVDRGGYRKRDGTLANRDIAKSLDKKEEITFNHFPPVCDSTTAESALKHLENLMKNPDSNS